MFDFYGQALLSTTKLSIQAGFTWFLILDKIQDGGRDGSHVWWRHRPHKMHLIKYTSPSKAFHWRLRFEILPYIKNSEDGFHQGTPLPLLPQWGYVCVYVYIRGLSFGYRENLFFFFELFKFDKSRYFPESYSKSEKKIVLLWEVSKFVHAALVANASKVDVSEF